MTEARARALGAQIQKARTANHKTGVLRKETLNALILSTRSSSTQMKVLAATNIQYFFKDFPELEEQAINAVYDFCEDQSPQVRIEGYRAISGISRAERRWVKRNADVLLQLLQSDEPEEVTVVKKALIEHLELEPRVTLGVLCDQLTPMDSAMDEEERSMRERLRSLVLDFLVGDALNSTVRPAKPHSLLEDIFLESIFGFISHLDQSDTAKVVGILASALSSSSAKGEALFQVLLNRVSTAIRSDLRGSRPAWLSQTRPELLLAQHIVLVNKITSPLGLLRYYNNSLTGKIFLQQLARDEQQWLISKLSDVLSFGQKNFPGDPEVLHCQWKIVDACPYLLEARVLIPTMLDSSSGTCSILLRTCLQRKNVRSWTVSANLTTVLEKMRTVIDISPPQENKRDLQKMIMFLLPYTTPQPSQAPMQPIIRTGRVMKLAERSATLQSTSQPLRKSSQDRSPQPPFKRQRNIGDAGAEGPHKVSLLSRLQPPATEAMAFSKQGLSIKGAAIGATGNAPKRGPPPSLLDRLQDAANLERSGSLAGPADLRKRKRGIR